MPEVKLTRSEQAAIIVKDIRSQTGLDVDLESRDKYSRLRLTIKEQPITLWSEGFRDFERQCAAFLKGYVMAKNTK